MTEVERCPSFCNSHFSATRELSAACMAELDLEQLKELLSGKAAPPYTGPSRSMDDVTRFSVQSDDSGYQSGSPKASLRGTGDKGVAVASGTYSLDRAPKVRDCLIQRQDKGRKGKENRSVSRAYYENCESLLLLSSVPEKNLVWMREGKEPPHHVLQPLSSAEWQTSPLMEAMRDDDYEEEEVPPCQPARVLYIVKKNNVRHLQETVLQVPSHKAVQSELAVGSWARAEAASQAKGEAMPGTTEENVSESQEELTSESEEEVLPSITAEVLPQRRKEVSERKEDVKSEVKGKTVTPQGKPLTLGKAQAMAQSLQQERLLTTACPEPQHREAVELFEPWGKIKVMIQSPNRAVPLAREPHKPPHKDTEEALQPPSKGEEAEAASPCKCDTASRLCEHLKDSMLRRRRKKDPLSGKKRLRRLFRGQFRKLYVPEDLEEPPFQYVPEVLPTSATIKGVVPPLQESLMLLGEGLEAGSLVAQFEQLYRRKPGLTVTEARRQDNEKKNRYRDISPYDTTRVILTTSPSGDYINASYVNMEVQASGIVNRYIASQGPLAGTCSDFWYMVWEQQSTLIVMLTTVVEQGRVKCHRYWPRLYETVDFGILQVTCNKEEETPGFAFREFTLINTETQEERHITHMQYLAWPDHGVPDDSTEFLNFVTQVRKARVGMVEPTIVHCSAGIGRTGVLILMETAQCLIEANEPIYPLDIVKAMRDQRAMMIQTASQFRFVCEAIHRVYTEELIKPLAEYEQR